MKKTVMWLSLVNRSCHRPIYSPRRRIVATRPYGHGKQKDAK